MSEAAGSTSSTGSVSGTGSASSTGSMRQAGTSGWATRARVSVVAGLLAVLGGAGFLATFQLEDVARPVGVAAVVGAAAGAVGQPGRAGTGALRFGALVVVVVVAGAALALADGGSPAALAQLGDGWSLIRDGHVPASPAPEALAVPFLATALAAAAGAWLTHSGGWRLRAWLPSLAVLVLGCVLGSTVEATPSWVPLAWAAVVLLSGSWGSGRAGTVATGLAAAVMLVLVGAATVLASEQVPLDEIRWRLPRSEGVQPQDDEQPLNQVSSLRSGPEEPLFTVDTPVPVTRWRLTALDMYDGSRWSSRQELRQAGRRLPEASDCAAPAGEEVTSEVELPVDEATWGRWLPAPEGVVATSLDGVLYDQSSATLRVPEDDALPESYGVTARLPSEAETAHTAAVAVTGSESWVATRLPEVEGEGADLLAELQELAAEITGGAAGDYGRAVAIQQFLLAGQLAEPDGSAPTGHSLRRVHELVSGSEEELVGTVDQYVTAFALLGRATGLPTRVVVGFEGPATTGQHQVTSHDATAWVEVCFEELGWVAFEAAPSTAGEVRPPELDLSSPELGQEPDGEADEETTLAENDGPDRPEEETNEPTSGRGGGRGLPGWLIALAVNLGFGALVAVAVAPPLRRHARLRWRQSAAAPAARIAGAWATVLDDLRVSGLALPGDQAVTRVVIAGSRRHPALGGPLWELGLLANRAAFGRRLPGETDADRAWHLANQVISERRQGRDWRQRLREHFRAGRHT